MTQGVRPLQVWDSDTESRIAFSPAMDSADEESSPPTIAHIVENDLILQALHERLLTLPSVELQRGARVSGVSLPRVWVGQGEEWVKVHLEDGRSLESRLLASLHAWCESGGEVLMGPPRPRWEQTGRSLRSAGGVGSRQWSGSTISLLLWQHWSCRRQGPTVPLGKDSSRVVQWPSSQYVSPTHPAPPSSIILCSCPSPQQLTENLSSLVWSTSPDHAKTLVAMGNTEFVDTLNSALVSVPCQCAGVSAGVGLLAAY